MYVILVYDISKEDNGHKRWNKIFKICKKYLTHIQNSVFEGDINESSLFELKTQLKNHLDKTQDSLIIFKSRNERWLDKDVLGKEVENKFFI